MQILATVDSILLAAIALVIGPHYPLDTPTHDAFAACTVFFLAASLALILYHVIPSMNSKVGNEFHNDRNPRSTIVIDKYPSKEAYWEAVSVLELEDMARYNSFQIYGMNRNIMRNQLAIRTAVYLTYVAMLSFAFVASGANFHAN
jgi:hypothetical protein